MSPLGNVECVLYKRLMRSLVIILFLLPASLLGAAPVFAQTHLVAVVPLDAPPTADVEKALEVADEFERERAWSAARMQLAAIVPHVSPKRAASFELRICHLWDLSGAVFRARNCYDELVERFRSQVALEDTLASAAYRSAAIWSTTEDTARALEQLRQVALDFPATVATRKATLLARDIHRSLKGPGAEADYLTGLVSQIQERDLLHASSDKGRAHYIKRFLAECLVAAGTIYHYELDKPGQAVEILKEVQGLAAGTAWWDDAVMELARALVTDKKYPPALTLYRSLIDARESSWFVGSYASQFLDEAFYEYARVLDAMQEGERAVAAYRELIKQVPSSRWVDDAAYHLALLASEEQRGEALLAFLHSYPESEHAAQVRSALP